MLVRVGPRGQITIPKVVRQRLGIKPGDSLAIISIDDDEIVLQPVTESIFDLVGKIPVQPDGPLSIAELREAAANVIVDRAKGSDEA